MNHEYIYNQIEQTSVDIVHYLYQAIDRRKHQTREIEKKIRLS